MDKILVTGGAGFIGSNLVNKLLEWGYSVIVVDNLSMGKKQNIKDLKNVEFIYGSVCDEKLMKKILQQNTFSYIFHLAAIASVAASIEQPVETNKVNFKSTLLLLELVRTYQKEIKRFVFASSAAVYGDNPESPKSEESPICPLSPYAIDKYASEQYVLIYSKLYGVPTSVVRFFNVYGPNQNANSPYSGVISILMNQYKKALNNEETQFKLYGSGEQSRDFIYIDDVIEACWLVATSDKSIGEVYNVGTGENISLNELIETFSKLMGVDIRILQRTRREGDIYRSVSSIEKLKNLGFNPQDSIKDGLDNYIVSEKKINDV